MPVAKSVLFREAVENQTPPIRKRSRVKKHSNPGARVTAISEGALLEAGFPASSLPRLPEKVVLFCKNAKSSMVTANLRAKLISKAPSKTKVVPGRTTP